MAEWSRSGHPSHSRKADITAQLERIEMKYFLLIIVGWLMLTTADAKDMSSAQLIDELQGVYKHRFLNRSYAVGDNETWQSEDIVEIVPYDDSHVYIRAHLEFANGHLCAIWGVAGYENGKFVYHDPDITMSNDGSTACTLTISLTKTDLSLTDNVAPNRFSTCYRYCGARGTFSDYLITRSSKRKIRYLDRLKASRQYLEAVEKFKSMKKGKPQ